MGKSRVRGGEFRRASWIALAVAMGLAAPAIALARSPWAVSGVAGKVKNGKAAVSKDVSGLACGPPRNGARICLIVDDETQGAQVAILEEGVLRAGGEVPLIDARLGKKLIELDAEAVAWDGDAFYVVGSHGRPRHEDLTKAAEDDAKALASKHIFRLRFSPGAIDTKTARFKTAPTVQEGRLSAFILAQPELSAAFDQPLDPNGLTIEGLAARDGALFVGFRGPVTPGGAYVLTAPLAAIFDGQPGEGKLLRVELSAAEAGKINNATAVGIRDLVADGDGFLGILGPEQDPTGNAAPRCGDYAIFRWPGAGSATLRPLDAYGDKVRHKPDDPVKPEGLAPLPTVDGKPRALLVFDGAEQGQPTPVSFAFDDGFACPK